MKVIPCCTAFCGTVFTLYAAAAGTPHGIIRFSGAVYSPASATVTLNVPSNPTGSAQRRRIVALGNAQHELASNVLAYFAGYAARNAQLVSVTYN